VLSDEARELRKQMLAISAIMAAILVFGISLPEFSLLGFKVSATQRQILALLTIGNLYVTIYFHLLATRDMDRWLAVSNSESYQKDVVSKVVAAHADALDALGDVTRLSKAAMGRLVQLFQIIRLALVFGENDTPPAETATEEAVTLAAPASDIPANPAEYDPALVAPLQAEAQSIIWQLQQVEPLPAARVEAALFAMLHARNGYYAFRRDSALSRWHYGWSIAYFPVLASSLLTLASVAAMVRPDWAALFAHFMTSGYDLPAHVPEATPNAEAKP